jgi:NDP-sugar pyrophosphorylase family protein
VPSPTLLVLAAGLGTRFGGLKQLAPVGPNDEAIMDFSARDAATAGFGQAVVLVRSEIEDQIRDHIKERWPADLPVQYVLQDRDPLAIANPREKPLGTAHAVLAARNVLDGDFAVINADDHYGAQAYRLLCDFLTGSDRNAQSLVGFRVRNTLLSPRPVTRALCRADADHRLVEIAEGTITTAEDQSLSWSDGTRTEALAGDELVSMNCWGFRPSILDVLDRAVNDFLDAGGATGTAEVLLPTVVGEIVDDGATVTVLASDDQCLGVTHADDVDVLRRTLA